MKFKKTILLLCLIALIVSCFAGCGKSAKDAAYTYEPSVAYDYSDYNFNDGGVNYAKAESSYDYDEYEYDEPTEMESNAISDSVPDSETVNNNLKLIYTVSMNVETLDYDSSIKTIDELTNKYGGYVEYSEVENDRINSHWLRKATYTLRIPAAELEDFVTSCGNVGNVCSMSKETENRTTEYTDLSSRLETLRIEEKSLQDLLENAVDLDTIVALHSYLSDVRYQIEQIQTRMRGIDGLVSYSTVHLYLNEVTVVTETVTPKSSFGDRLSARLHNSWIDFTEGMEDFGVFAFGELPLILLRLILILLPFAIIIFVIVLLIRKGRKKRKAKKALAAQKKGEVPEMTQSSENRQE